MSLKLKKQTRQAEEETNCDGEMQLDFQSAVVETLVRSFVRVKLLLFFI